MTPSTESTAAKLPSDLRKILYIETVGDVLAIQSRLIWLVDTAFAFKFVGIRPHGLLTKKTAIAFMTTGGPKIIHKISGNRYAGAVGAEY